MVAHLIDILWRIFTLQFQDRLILRRSFLYYETSILKVYLRRDITVLTEIISNSIPIPMNKYSFVEKLTVLISVTAFIFSMFIAGSLPGAIITGTSMLSLAIVANGNKNQE